MRQAFAHEAVLIMEPDADVRAPGAAITAALCGHWDHGPPCPLAPHHVRVEEVEGEVRVRILFAAEPDAEQQVRHLIEQALSGKLTFPDGFITPWRLRSSRPCDVSADEKDHARRLTHSCPVPAPQHGSAPSEGSTSAGKRGSVGGPRCCGPTDEV